MDELQERFRSHWNFFKITAFDWTALGSTYGRLPVLSFRGATDDPRTTTS
jgi:hypothetical protein